MKHVAMRLGICALGLALAGCGGGSSSSQGSSGFYKYTLNNVSFTGSANGGESSGTASGFFDYNPATAQFGDFDITTSSGQVFNGPMTPGYDYVPGDSKADFNTNAASGVDAGALEFISTASSSNYLQIYLKILLPAKSGPQSFDYISEVAATPNAFETGAARIGTTGNLIASATAASN